VSFTIQYYQGCDACDDLLLDRNIVFIEVPHRECSSGNNYNYNCVALVLKRTIPTERPALVDEVSVNFVLINVLKIEMQYSFMFRNSIGMQCL
jgi:hypothetical protein